MIIKSRLSGGTLVEHPDLVQLVEGSAGPAAHGGARSITLPGSGVASDQLIDAMQAQDFELADAFVFFPPPGRPALRAAPGEAVELEVPLAPNEGALLLIESDGVYAWHYPEPESPNLTRRLPGGSARFRFAPPGALATGQAPGHRGPVIDWLANKLVEPVRVWVLKYAARKAAGLGVSWLERNVRPGLIEISDVDPQGWALIDNPSRAWLQPTGARPRILLFVHGTFSSTRGGFGSLATHAEGIRLLEQALSGYDRVFGFDHLTLSVDPMINAQLLFDTLRALDLPAGTAIDTISHSRGGLVFRCLAERLLPQSPLMLELRRSVFIGCTNAGTALAEPAHWERLLDLYTNVAVAGCRAIGLIPGAGGIASILGETVKTLGSFAQYVAETSINDRAVPGLAAMAPAALLHTELNQANSVLPKAFRAAYYALGSDFEPNFNAPGFTKGLKAFLVDRMADRLMAVQNDLVVDTASMSEFGLRADLLRERLVLLPRDSIYHTVYFARPRIARQLGVWLDLATPASLLETRPSIDLSRSSPSFRLPQERGYPSSSDALIDYASPKSDSKSKASRNDATRNDRHDVAIVRDLDEGPTDPVDLEVHAEMPERPLLGQTVDVRVTIAHGAIVHSEGPTSRKATFIADPDKDLLVRIRGKSNCRITSEDRAAVPIPARGDHEELEFSIEGLSEGQAEIWVEVFQGPRRLSVVVLQPNFIGSGMMTASTSVKPEREERAVVDLRIIDEVVAGDEPIQLLFILTCPELAIDCEASSEPSNAVSRSAYVASIYQEIEQRWRNASRYGSDAESDEELLISLQGYGINLFNKLVPEKIQRALWNNRERIGCIRVITREPSIPWEILHLKDPDKPAGDLGTVAFLGDLGVLRWHNERGYPPARLRLRDGFARYVIPDYDDPHYQLKSTGEEREFIESLFGATRIPASRREVREALNRCGAFDLLHFACHGSANPGEIWKSGLYLESKTPSGAYETLEEAQVSSWADLSERPIIFLNACQVGQQGSGLVGAGGLAQAFLEKGAGLIVAPLWSVGDRSALSYAKAFYGELVAGGSVASAARAARQAARKSGDPTWLAYMVYGHPYAHLHSVRGEDG